MMIDAVTRDEIEGCVYTTLTTQPYMIEDIFGTFLMSRYNITLEQFDKLIKENIPEELV